jgi:hypothetical protein
MHELVDTIQVLKHQNIVITLKSLFIVEVVAIIQA